MKMGDIQAAKSDIVEAEDLEETGDEFGGPSAVKQEPLDQQDHEEPQTPRTPRTLWTTRTVRSPRTLPIQNPATS